LHLSTMVDVAFKNAGKKPGLEIWRIEKMKVVQITDTEKFGKFYSGDSYIVLLTEKNNNALKWDIHFWLGEETSQDEMGVAAYKTVELDDSLGGAPVQHREVQGHESQQFEAIFKPYGGLRYLAGGIDSGFKKVDRDAFEKRLLQIKGKRNVRVNQVELSHKSLNRGDVFILDIGMKLYQWNGEKSSRAERAKGLEVIKGIRDEERGGKAQIVVIEDGKDDDTAFFADLGGKGPVKEAADDDETFEKKKNAEIKLYRVSDSTGKMVIEEVGSGLLRKDQLDTNDCFILDTSQQLLVWIGKKATKEEKNSAWTLAQKFITDKNYPAWTPCTRVVEGGETTLFIQQFGTWPKPQDSSNFSQKSSVSKVQKKDVDINKLLTVQKQEKQKMVDDGSGTLEIWRVENFDKAPVDKKEYGQFYQGDSYVMLYTYKDSRGKENYIIYFWQGLDSSQDEKGASALLATALDDQYGGAPVQVRVVQNKEPEHFLALFKGKFIIHRGGHASGFKNSTEQTTAAAANHLYHVKGTSSLNTKAVEVDFKASSLNSNDCFVVLTPKNAITWFGKYATGDEREVAKSVAETLMAPSKVEAVFEGKEKDYFWELLGGKEEYATKQLEAVPEFEPRLFQCSNASGNFDVEEIFDFSQEDLISDDIMLLDAWNEIFLWIGNGANVDEKKAALEMAINYLKNSPGGRTSENTPILTVKQGFEPPLFTCHFIWDHEKAKAGIDDYEQLKKELESGGGLTSNAQKELAKYSKTYPYEVLLKRPLPEGVDASRLENHLDDADFKKALGLTHEEFLALPKWKRDAKKRESKLF
jgi:hypothetical protein